MPVSTLFVEGDLDVQLLRPVFDGHPVIENTKSGKYGLKSRVRTERKKIAVRNNTSFTDSLDVPCYIRDRDFDFLPPEYTCIPTIDAIEDNDPEPVLGWRWSRHSIENYLLQPEIVAACFKVNIASVEDSIAHAAREIRFYEAARWTIGDARRALPPNYELNTFPDDGDRKEFFLPAALDEPEMSDWTQSHSRQFFERISDRLNEKTIGDSYCGFKRQFSDEFVETIDTVLLWFSGKDLMAAMTAVSQNPFGMDSPGKLRGELRDCFIENCDMALSHLPEWSNFREAIRPKL